MGFAVNDMFLRLWRPLRLERPKRVADFAAALAVVIATSGMAGAAGSSDDRLKAVFLFNIAKFVEWPASAFHDRQSPMTICVLGDNPFGHDLDEIIRGQAVGGRSLAVRRMSQIQGAETCHVLFVGSPDRSRLEQVASALGSLPILTVCDARDLVRTGSIIRLFLEKNKVRFDVDLEASERAGLKISSRVLKLAKNVHNGKKN